MFKPLILLTLSNIFMTSAWYGHLKNMKGKRLKLDYVWAGCCPVGAADFMFRGGIRHA